MENKNLKVTNLRWYPQYHIAAPAGWVNDPNGFSYFKGQCHFFYQYYPYGVEWGPMHWGHVVSKDLIHWEHLPIALAPDKDYDKDGVFSGSGIEAAGKFYLMYTGHVNLPKDHPSGFSHIEKQCIAISEDGINFTKYEKNPVISELKDIDASERDFRDPKVWKHGGKYFAVLGSKNSEMTHGEILIYESEDLENWKFKSIAARAEGNQGNMWECPNFAEVDGKDVLIFSPMAVESEGNKFVNNVNVAYFVGDLDYSTGIFNHGKMELLDYGFDFYAPQVTETPDGRTILIGWLQMWHVPQPEQADGWAGQMTIPREISVKDGKIFMSPIKELENLRTSEKSYKNLKLNEVTKLDGIGGEVGELILSLDAKEKFSLELRNTLKISYNPETSTVKITRDGSGDEKLSGSREAKISPCSELKLRIYLDKSSAEIFVNDGEIVFSARIYPGANSQSFNFIPEKNNLAIKEVTFYKLSQAVPNPRM